MSGERMSVFKDFKDFKDFKENRSPLIRSYAHRSPLPSPHRGTEGPTLHLFTILILFSTTSFNGRSWASTGTLLMDSTTPMPSTTSPKMV